MGKLYKYFRLCIVIAFIALVVWKIDFVSVYRNLRPSVFQGMLWCQPIKMIGLILISSRLALLVQRPIPPFLVVFKATILSVGLNIVLPFRVSEIIKPAYLWNHAKIPLSVGASAALFERLSDLIIFGLFAIACVMLNITSINVYGLIGISFFLCALLFLFPFLESPLRLICSFVPSQKFRSFAGNFLAHSIGHITARTKYVSLGLGVVIWTVSYCTVVIFLFASGYQDVGLDGAFTVFVATTVGLSIPLLPGGIGTYEAGAVVALNSLGIAFNEAVAVAISLHISQFALFFLIATSLLLRERTGLSSLIRRFLQEYGLA